MKRLFLSVLFLSILFISSGCEMMEDTSDNDNSNSKTHEIIFDNVLTIVDIAVEYDIEGDSLNTYSNKDDIGISYVNIQEFLELLQGGIINLNVEKTNTLNITYTVLVDDDYIDLLGFEDYKYELTIDANSNTITFNDFNFLDNLNVEMESEYLTDITLVDFDVSLQDYGYIIDLNEYDLDIILYKNDYYIPLYLANLFFSGSNMNVYEMEDELYLIDNFSDLSELTNNFASDVEYDLNNIKNHTSKYLALYFDNFYGLKGFHEVDSYLDEVSNFNIDKQTTVNNFYTQIDKFLMRRDDLHTSLVTAGYRYKDYIKSSIYLNDEKIKSYLDTYYDCGCYNRSEEITYGTDENTMVITINAFSLDTKDLIAPIMEEAKNYDDIIFDLSCNSGGSIIGVLEVLVYLTDKPLPISYINPITNNETTEYYNSSTSKYIDKNYYLKTSEVTFSAANLFASMFRDMNLGPIMGTNTSGGAAAITYTVLPDGAIIVNSSNMVFINENKKVIEDGIDVDKYSNYNSGWWRNINKFENILEDEPSFKFIYDNLTENLNFNFRIEADLEVEEFVLTFKNYYTGELVKEFVFTDLVFDGSFKKPEHLDEYVVTLRAKYKYKTIFSNELISLGEIDKDLDIVGDYNYKEVSVGKSFSINSFKNNDLDVVRLNLTESGLYTIDSSSGTRFVTIYDESYNSLGSFRELQLPEGTYYVMIKNTVGDHEYTIKTLVDDNEGKTIINLVDGENTNNVYLDYYSDDETYEFTLNEDKIITLSFNRGLDYQIFDANGNRFDSDISKYDGWSDYTYLFPKGTYTIKVYNATGLVNFSANVTDTYGDLYTDDFSKDNEFGKLSSGDNLIIIDYKDDQDIYYLDITEKGFYVFEGEYMSIYKIDENGNYNPLLMRKVFELDEGRHYFAFSKENSYQKSFLKLELNLIIDESDEDNHVSINIGEEVTTKVINHFDKDYFDFTITESGTYRIRFNSDNSHVRYDIYNENNERVLFYKKYHQEITLSEGNYTIVLYQPEINGDKLRNASFVIIKQ